VLRTVIATADENKQSLFLHFNSKPKPEALKDNELNLDLNKIMQNVDGEQFDYQSFKNIYDTDPRVKALVHNFNEDGIEPKTEKNKDVATQNNQETDSVEKMAKRATDLNDL